MIQDPREEKIIEKLVEIIGGAAVAFVSTLDAIAEESTCKACADVVKTLGGGKVVTNRAEGLTVKLEGVELLPGELKCITSSDRTILQNIRLTLNDEK